MQDLKVSIIQTELVWEKPEENRKQFENYFDTIEQADLVVLPEMFSTGFTMNAENVAETMDGPTVSWMLAEAKKRSFSIMGSLVIEENGHFFNRLLNISPDGRIDSYDKMHLFSLAKEDEHYTSGKETRIISIKGWNIMLQVCFDLRFQTPFANEVKQDQFKYDVLINVANWPAIRSTHWKALLRSRAIENQCYVIGVNRVGKDNKGYEYSGDSAVINVEGDYEVQSQPNQSGIFSVYLSKEKLKEARKKLPFLKDKLI